MPWLSIEEVFRLSKENSPRGRAFRRRRVNEDPRSKAWARRIERAIRQGLLVPEEIVYCADDPTRVDPSLCTITKQQMIKFIRDSGAKDYGKMVARMMGESTETH